MRRILATIPSSFFNAQIFLCTALLVFCSIGALQAQQNLCAAGGGGFTIDYEKGCVPHTINVTNTVPGVAPANIQYYFNYRPGDAISGTSTGTSFTYASPGTYTVLQLGTGAGKSFCKVVTVLDNRTPAFTVTSCGNLSAKVTITNNSIAQQYDQIEVRWNDGTTDFVQKPITSQSTIDVEHIYPTSGQKSIQVRGIYNSGGNCGGSGYTASQITLGTQQLSDIKIDKVEAGSNGTARVFYRGLAGVETEAFVKTGTGTYIASGQKDNRAGRRELVLTGLNLQEPVCIQLTSKDACNNSTNSAEVCVPVMSLQAVSEQNNATWTASSSTSFSKYEVVRDGQSLHTSATQSETTFSDSDVECDVTYSYQAISYSTIDTAISAPVEVIAISTSKPSTVAGALVTVETDGSAQVLALDPPTGATAQYSMIFERSSGRSGIFQEVGNTENDNRFTDRSISSSTETYCYRISYENACGVRSDPSSLVCTILLQRTDAQIKWTSESPFLDPVDHYSIIRIDNAGLSTSRDVGLILDHDTKNDPPSQQIYNYQIQATSPDGFFMSYSNIVDFREKSGLFIPNAFSPNGDQFNNTFAVQGTFITSSKMIIYDRWGSVVFMTDNATTGWDGTLNSSNTPAPTGNYVYRIEITDSTDKTVVKSGTLLLLR